MVGFIVLYLIGMVLFNVNHNPFNLGFIDFSRPEVLGFSNLLSALFSGLAAVLLIETFWVQFNEFKRVKNEKDVERRKEAYHRLKLLELDLIEVLEDIQTRSNSFTAYANAERDFPFQLNMLLRTSARKYSRIIELDRESLFFGFQCFFNDKNESMKHFSNLYKSLDYLPDLFEDTYQKFDYHVNNQFERKKQVGVDLDELLFSADQYLKNYNRDRNHSSFLHFSAILDKLETDYYKTIITQDSQKENYHSETNLELISKKVLSPFMASLFNEKSNTIKFDLEVLQMGKKAGDIIEKIQNIRKEGAFFAHQVESQNKILMEGYQRKKSTVVSVKEVLLYLQREMTVKSVEEIE